jgi:hypothetical protein
MTIKTKCESCIFSSPVSGGDPTCKFNIIDYIKDIKNININQDFYYIDDYVCRFAFGKDTYENNKEELKTIDLVQVLLDRSSIKYYLIMELSNEDCVDQMVDSINNLSILPKFISFVTFKYANHEQLIEKLSNKLNKKIQWKIHKFLVDETIDHRIHPILDTNKRANNSHYFLVCKGEEASGLENYIMRINTMINIEQIKFHILMKDLSHSIYGIFMSFDHYGLIRSLISPIGIEELSKDPSYLIRYYV